MAYGLVFGVLFMAALVCRGGVSARAEERGHVFSHVFGSVGGGQGELREPEGLAVDEATGEVYVADRGNHRVEIFHESEGVDSYVGEFNGSGLLAGEGKAAGSGGLPGEVETGLFDAPAQVAVDNTCHTQKLSGVACERFDPSNGDVYVIDEGEGHEVVDKYTSAGAYIGQIAEDSAEKRFVKELYGVAVGSDGDVYVTGVVEGETLRHRVFEFSNATHNGCGECEVGSIETEGSGTGVSGFLGHGLAVDASGNVFVPILRLSVPSGVVEYTSAGVKLRELATPSWGLGVEVFGGDVYVGRGGVVERFGPVSGEVEALEVFGVSGLVGGGVGVDGVSGDVFVSDVGLGRVDVFGLEGAGAPTVKGSVVEDVGVSSARFVGVVNPRGAATSYRVEFGRCGVGGCAGSGFEGSVPGVEGVAGERFEPAQVSVPVSGLVAGVEYHFRIVASNRAGGELHVSEGEEVVFRTRVVSGGLLDGREWELVSPELKGGAVFEPLGQLSVTQAAADGGAMTYAASNPTEEKVAGFSNDVQVLSRRVSPGVWESKDIPVPHETPTGKTVSLGQEYRMFSEDLSRAIVQPFGAFVPFVTGASGQTAYLRSNYTGSGGFCGEGCYRPLVTGCPGAGKRCEQAVAEWADVPAGTDFTLTGEACEIEKVCGPEVRAASSDLSTVLVQSESGVGLTEGTSGGLYEWFDGRLHYVGAGLLDNPEAFAWVADGGSETITGNITGEGSLELVDPVAGESVGLDAGSCGGCESGGGGDPWVVDGGARVFFRDARRLTEGSDGGAGAFDLYECDVTVSPVACGLSDLTPKVMGAHADVLGIVGVNETGSSVYFVANGKLAAGAVEGTCVEGARTGGECNLYVEQRTGAGWGQPRLVAVVSGDDEPDWSDVMEHHTARAAGEWLVFMSDRSLTGYDTQDILSNQPDEEVYEYHAEGTGGLACVSCNPTGERPHGIEYGKLGLTVADHTFVWPSAQWLSGSVPGWTPYSAEVAGYESRFLLSSGRVFFDSSDGLVAGDGNGLEDVYEWEPVGVGSCRVGSDGFGGVAGCLGLVSSGTAGEESEFLDASVSGGDVFFLTGARLVAGDGDSAVDVYDAHECLSGCVVGSVGEVAGCATGESCHAYSGVAGGGVGALASEAFSGSGNFVSPLVGVVRPLTRAQKLARALRVCARDRNARKRRLCQARARRAYAGRVRIARRGARVPGRVRTVRRGARGGGWFVVGGGG